MIFNLTETLLATKKVEDLIKNEEKNFIHFRLAG